MTLKERERYMREQIPMLDYQDISIVEYGEEGVVLEAPFAPNKNVHETAYAGALNSLLTAAAWLCCNRWAETLKQDCTVVMQSGTIRFLRPHRGLIRAKALPPVEEYWLNCQTHLEKKGKAVLKIHAEVREEKIHAAFEGNFHISIKK